MQHICLRHRFGIAFKWLFFVFIFFHVWEVNFQYRWCCWPRTRGGEREREWSVENFARKSPNMFWYILYESTQKKHTNTHIDARTKSKRRERTESLVFHDRFVIIWINASITCHEVANTSAFLHILRPHALAYNPHMWVQTYLSKIQYTLLIHIQDPLYSVCVVWFHMRAPPK